MVDKSLVVVEVVSMVTQVTEETGRMVAEMVD
jgi:hypothetical protein